jgi:LAS superfamily LD-carboxypeptidase LdcB
MKHANIPSDLLLTGKTDQHISYLTNRIGIHQEMLTAWLQLQDGAKTAGFDLQIASGFRNFERQLSIWNNKYALKTAVKDKQNKIIDLKSLNVSERINAILYFSALPGASRHHWGTDIDVFAANLLSSEQKLQLEPWEYQHGGPFADLSQWLSQHCQHYGFYRPYDIDRGGVAIEPWHLSYAPLSQQYQQTFSLALITSTIATSDILAKEEILTRLPSIYKKTIMNVNTPQITV